MADVAAPAPAPAQTQPVSGTSLRRLVGATEIDLRLFGMLLALIGILVGFHIMSGGTFIRPANMVTLAVQATGIAIMATGMVLIIVSRNIDLSVGSIVGLVAMSIALLQTDWLPALGLGSDSQWMWLIALGLGLGLGAIIGGLQGFIIAYIGVPSFIVTLGGLLSLRGTVWLLSSGAGINGLQTEFRKIGGGVDGSVGEWATWLLAAIGMRRHHCPDRLQPAPTPALRLSGATDVGRGPDRGRRLHLRPRHRRLRQHELPAAGSRDPVRRGARHHRARGRAESADRSSRGRSSWSSSSRSR